MDEVSAERIGSALRRMASDLAAERRQVVALKRENIGTGLHYTAVHLHPYYREAWGFRRGEFPAAEYVSDRIFSLPLFPRMTDEDQADVIAALRRLLGGKEAL